VDDASRTALILGLLLLPVFAAWWRGLIGAIVAFAALIVVFGVGVFLEAAPLSAVRVWLGAFPLAGSLRMLLWCVLCLLVARLAPLSSLFHGATGAFIGGFALGPAVAFGRSGDLPPAHRASWVLTALAGASVSPLGNPVAFVVGRPLVASETFPLALLLLVPALVRSLEVRGDRWLSALALGVFPLALLRPDLGMALALSGAAALLLFRKKPPPAPRPGWLIGLPVVALAVLLLTLAGPLDLLAKGLYDAEIVLADTLGPALGGASLLLSALGTPLPAALAIRELSEAAPIDFHARLAEATALGAGIGAGLPALVLAGPGCLRAGAWRWAIQILLVLAWTWR
jgi:hypothetical protein